MSSPSHAHKPTHEAHVQKKLNDVLNKGRSLQMFLGSSLQASQNLLEYYSFEKKRTEDPFVLFSRALFLKYSTKVGFSRQDVLQKKDLYRFFIDHEVLFTDEDLETAITLLSCQKLERSNEKRVERPKKAFEDQSIGNRVITWEQFFKWWSQNDKNKKLHELRENERFKECMATFQQYDVDLSGNLDFKELRRLYLDLGLESSDESLHQIMKILDRNRDNLIDFNEWLASVGF